MSSSEEQKLPLSSLTAMVIGSMVGAGIFNLPGRFATATGPFGALIAWAIAGAGMYMLARVFQSLAERRPDIDSGVFAYAKAGFGDYMGFLSAFGYWLGSCLGNTFYWVLISIDARPVLSADLRRRHQRQGDHRVAHRRLGVPLHDPARRQGSDLLNTIVTVAKIVPIIVAILAFVFFFNYSQFSENFFGGVGMPDKSLLAQVRDTMLITVFVFIGIEGASVYSRYAEKRSDVGAATVLGFVAVTGLMVAITLLPYATAPRAAIAGVSNPSLAGALELVVGHWGAVFISIGVLGVSAGRLSGVVTNLRGSALRGRTIEGHATPVCRAERQPGSGERAVAYQHCRLAVHHLDLLVPRRLQLHARHDERDDPLPYLLVAGYGVLLARSGVGYETAPDERGRDQIFAWIAVVYTVFMFVAAGLKYVLLAAVLFAPGTILYFWARREQKRPYVHFGRTRHLRRRADRGRDRRYRPRDRPHHAVKETGAGEFRKQTAK